MVLLDEAWNPRPAAWSTLVSALIGQAPARQTAPFTITDYDDFAWHSTDVAQPDLARVLGKQVSTRRARVSSRWPPRDQKVNRLLTTTRAMT